MAEKIRVAIRKDLDQQKKYYEYLRVNKEDYYNGFARTEVPINDRLLQVLGAIEQKYGVQTSTNKPVETPITIDNRGNPDTMPKTDSPI